MVLKFIPYILRDVFKNINLLIFLNSRLFIDDRVSQRDEMFERNDE